MSEVRQAVDQILPHRYPFLLVDRVTEFVPGERIVGVKNFTANDDVCQGLTGGTAQVPAGILIEAVTQLGAVLVLEQPGMAGKIPVILQIPQARMIRPVGPGEDLRLEAQAVKLKESFGELRGLIYSGAELVAEGQMRFGIANARDVLPS